MRTELDSVSVWLIDNKSSLHFGKRQSVLVDTKRHNTSLHNCYNHNIMNQNEMLLICVAIDTYICLLYLVLKIIDKSSPTFKCQKVKYFITKAFHICYDSESFRLHLLSSERCIVEEY